MRTRKLVIGILLAAALASLPFVLARITHAQEQGSDLSQVISKLDELLRSQRAMMDQIASLKQELGVIKIRVTQQQ